MSDFGYKVVRVKESAETISLNYLFLYLLEGKVRIRVQGDEFPMSGGDVLFLQPGIRFEVPGASAALAGIASFPSSVIAQVLEGRHAFFTVNSVWDDTRPYEDLRSIASKLTAEFTMRRHTTKSAQFSLLYRLLDCLIEHYQTGELASSASPEEKEGVRMQAVMQYIMENIDGRISLTELAEQMYVAPSTLSRTFYRQTGVYFADYVQELRIRNSLTLLCSSDRNLTEIAMNCGFSTSSAYHRAFKKIMNVSPSEYRTQFRSRAEKERQEREKEEEAVREELRAKGYEDINPDISARAEISLEHKHPVPVPKIWNQVINIGDLYSLTQANVQFHILYLQEQLHFTYVRVWNVFSQKMMLTDGTQKEPLNMDLFNQAMDFLVQHHLKPYLDFGRKPEMVLRSEGTEGKNLVYSRNAYISFASREIWNHAFSQILDEMIRRYGEEEVSTWMFELSRETYLGQQSPLYQDSRYDFFQAWRAMHNELHERLPDARLGGTSARIMEDRDLLKSFYSRCVRENCPPDFASFILFPAEMADVSEDPDRSMEETSVKAMRELLQETGLGRRKIVLSEWNVTISSRNFINDSCYRSAYLADGISKMWGGVDLAAVMGGTDWVGNYLDTSKMLNGCVGLISKDMIRKPVFFAMDFLNRLGETLLGCGDHYIASGNKSGEICLLLHHFRPMNGRIREGGLDRAGIRQFCEGRKLKLTVTLTGLEQGSYEVKRKILNSSHGSILREWGGMQFKARPDREEIKYLQAVTIPLMEISQAETGEEGVLELTFELQMQEVDYVRICPYR